MKRAIAAYRAGLSAYETLGSFVYSAVRFRKRARFAFDNFNGARREALVVAMNGPTLPADLDRIDHAFPSCDTIDFAVANHFADTDYFSLRKPRHYFFSDPYFWDDASDAKLIEKRFATFHNISSQTTWPMRVYFPVHANASVFDKSFSDHDHIDLCPFNAAGLPTNYGSLQAAAWRRNLCAPFGQNVLIHVIYGGVQLGYPQIAIAGAGFSFHEQIHVDQRSNAFMKRRRHVYGDSVELAFLNQSKKEPATVVTEFQALYNAFRSLEAVAAYGKASGCHIVNYSEYSYLDMFDRPVGPRK